MRRLQIGMWEQFSPDRWEQLAMPLITGMEVCCLPDRAALAQVRDFCRQHGLGYGIHGPVLAEDGYRLPVLNAPDPRQFKEELQYITSEVELASSYDADYILFHYPFYPVFQEPFTPFPRLPDIGHRYSCEQLGRGQFRDISMTLFEHLAELQQRFKQRIVLEHDEDERFGDAYAYLEYVAARNHQFHVTFEHDASLVSRQELDAIYRQTAALLKEKESIPHSS